MQSARCLSPTCNKRLFDFSIMEKCNITIRCNCGTHNVFNNGKQSIDSKSTLNSYQNNLNLKRKNG